MSKLPNVGTTIFTTMSRLANETGAINLSQGFPNFPVDPGLLKIYKDQIDQNVHQYEPMSGSIKLTEQLSLLTKSQYGRTVDHSKEVLVTAGATQAIFTTILGLIDKGDEVIILDPSYDCYEPAVILAGGKPVRIDLTDDFLPDWNRINEMVSERTRMIITNNPHNPSGRVWSENDMLQLQNLVQENNNLLVLSDEVYEYIFFGEKHLSVNSYPAIREKAIVVSSFGKTFHVTGWKMGYMIAPEEILIEIKKVHQFNVFSVNSVAQHTLAEYLKHVNVNALGNFYKEKRDFFSKSMQDSRFKLLTSEGTYFQLADYSEISDKPDVDFCIELTEKHGVAAIPVSVFNKSGKDLKIIRFCFAKNEATLLEATQRLCKI